MLSNRGGQATAESNPHYTGRLRTPCSRARANTLRVDVERPAHAPQPWCTRSRAGAQDGCATGGGARHEQMGALEPGLGSTAQARIETPRPRRFDAPRIWLASLRKAVASPAFSTRPQQRDVRERREPATAVLEGRRGEASKLARECGEADGAESGLDQHCRPAARPASPATGPVCMQELGGADKSALKSACRARGRPPRERGIVVALASICVPTGRRSSQAQPRRAPPELALARGGVASTRATRAPASADASAHRRAGFNGPPARGSPAAIGHAAGTRSRRPVRQRVGSPGAGQVGDARAQAECQLHARQKSTGASPAVTRMSMLAAREARAQRHQQGARGLGGGSAACDGEQQRQLRARGGAGGRFRPA